MFENISSYDKILKTVCWMLRFIKNVKHDPPTRTQGPISSEEIKHAEIIICRYIQSQSFKGVTDKSLINLNPIIDTNNVIRIKTRIFERIDNENFRTPIVLPSEHPIVTKIIRSVHLRMNHAGIQFVMNQIRESFWIIKSRKTIRKVLKKCVICKKFDKQAMQAPQPVLPAERVRDSKIFEIIGVDLTGPLFLKAKNKVWIVIFTCAVYRAVHLEIASSLTTENFLQAFRRFVSRRGRPLIVFSDNGRNFLGTDNMFGKLDWDIITTKTSVQQIKWKFIPPSSPWWGGWWERMIGILKRILRKVLNRSSLNYESLSTVLCDCENIINNRPLTYLSEDKDDLIALTPAMFLNQIPMSGVPEIDHIEGASIRKKLVRQQKIICDLRKRFRSEYFGQLKQSAKYVKNPTTLKIGDLVLVSGNDKRINWPLARITELLPSKDGIVRLVRVKTNTGQHLKTVQNLIPLEVDSECEPNTYAKKLISSSSDLKVGMSRIYT